MRRRDANDSLGTRSTRWSASVALSLTLHAALVAATAAVLLVRASAPPLIRISLLSGKGRQEPAGVSSGDAPAALPPPEPARRDVAPRQIRSPRVRAQGPKRPSHAIAKKQRSEPVAVDAAAQAQLVTASAESGNLDGAGGDEIAHLSGTGSGHAPGSGTGDGLDRRAFCVYCPEPYYPLIARARGWQGTVEVALSVLADGSVNGARLGRSSGYPALDEAAIAVARQSRFRLPPDGLSKPLRGRIEYRFILSSR
jgi:TonB family protein